MLSDFSLINPNKCMRVCMCVYMIVAGQCMRQSWATYQSNTEYSATYNISLFPQGVANDLVFVFPCPGRWLGGVAGGWAVLAGHCGY